MRNKIIAVNAIIVLIVGLLSFALVRSALSSAADNPAQLAEDAKHGAQGASARLQFDALRTERWLAAKASDSATVDALSKATASARSEAATAVCESLASVAKGMFEAAPSLVVLVDAHGKSLGRNGSQQMRNEDLGSVYPGLKDSIATGHSASDVWINKARNDQYLVSYSPVRDASGVIGVVVAGTTLNDELSRVSDATTGRALALVVPAGDGLDIVAQSTTSNSGLEAAVKSNAGAKDSIKGVLASGHASAAGAGDLYVGAAALEGIGGGKHTVALVSEVPASLLENPSGLAMPILAVMGLGLVLVIVGGWLLGNYITRPINMLEEGLLLILNGQSDKRFELDHPDLGGLAFRIDQLLNQLMGVEEDTTDDEGRVSMAPAVTNFNDAMAVDEKPVQSEVPIDQAIVQRLAAEPGPHYYARLYGEYIAAKSGIGEPTSHISEQAFVARIQGMERDAAAKHGKPVRYQVKASGKEVVLVALPLP